MKGMSSRVVRISWAVASILLGVASREARAQDELFVANASDVSVTVYVRNADGNVAPVRTIKGAATGLLGPLGLAVDKVNNEVFVANRASITVYTLTANGNVAPLRTISGGATGLNGPAEVAVDAAHNELFVTNNNGNSVTIYSRTANGNVAPLRTVVGASTGLSEPEGVAVDTVNDEVVVANFNPVSITVYSRTANGNAAPLRTLAGAGTGLGTPIGVALDTVHDELFVANGSGNDFITVYSRTANGNTAALRTIVGAATGLSHPFGVTLDLVNDELFVSNFNIHTVTVYTRTANGNAAPVRTLSGAATGLVNPAFLGVTSQAGGGYFTVTPCRVLDTRRVPGPYGGPSLAHQGTRNFVIAGQCGIPSGTKSVAVNFTVVQPTNGPGFLTLFPGGTTRPLFASINYSAGQIRGNNAIVPLGFLGDIDVFCSQGGGTVDFVLDITGYFQ